MTPEKKRKLLFGGIGLVGLLCVVVVCAGTIRSDRGDPTGYIRDHYQRATFLDEPDGGAAYTSPGSRTAVVSALREHTRELNHRRAEQVDFLQYERHIVAVHDRGTGSMIYLDDYRDGYQRYASSFPTFVLFGWSSSPPGSSGFRGGGGGFGK